MKRYTLLAPSCIAMVLTFPSLAQNCVVRDYECVSLGPGSAWCTGSVMICDNCYRNAEPGESGNLVTAGGSTTPIYCRTDAAEYVINYLCVQGSGVPGSQFFCRNGDYCCAIAPGAPPAVIAANGNCRELVLGNACTGG